LPPQVELRLPFFRGLQFAIARVAAITASNNLSSATADKTKLANRCTVRPRCTASSFNNANTSPLTLISCTSFIFFRGRARRPNAQALLRHAPGVMGGLPSGGPRRARITGSASDSPKIVVTSLVHLYDSPVLMPGLPVQTRAKHSHRAPVIAPGLFSHANWSARQRRES